MSETYKERVNRWRIMRHDDLPEGHKAEYRAAGINPDELWSLIWSFESEEAALKCLADEEAHAAKWQSFKIVDGGEAVEIERSVWL
ncbi:hypothetical protein KIP88_02570 [Bradyrhizobium sp. SRL28]|uniref:hypothetical protein n=1 Tax=Bradyrhizobium sp. SRL28 TaxID=2836178 RepID=UPI001BDE72E2|nr:hypothetical protein [Bradyrhizobium sp. SRL28]MBT1509374.1 hypothetical protein [Bradyrhizobium sp. SRL28]